MFLKAFSESHWLSVITGLLIAANAVSFSGNRDLNPLINALKLSTGLHYRPKTLRILSSVEPLESYFDLWTSIYQIVPVLLIPTRLSMKGRKKFFASTVLLLLFNENDLKTVEKHLQEETVNRRWDRLVLIGCHHFIQTPKILTILNGYRVKIAFAIDTSQFLVESGLFQEKMHLIPITSTSVETYNEGPQMGRNLRGRHFRVAGCEFPPWILKVRNDGKTRVWGTHYEIVSFSSKKFNFTFESNVLDGPNYGELYPNGTWTGMYAMIYYRERNYDFSYLLGHDYSWSAFVDYASTFDTIDLVFATTWPSNDLKWTALFEPLQWQVWSWTFASFILTSIAIWIFSMFHQKRTNRGKSLMDSLQTSWALVLEQGTNNKMVGIRIRLIITIWLIGTIIINTGYKSTLKSRLTFPTPEILPTNYKELADRDDFTIILNAQGVVEKVFFAETKVPEMVNIRNRMLKEASTEKCVEDVFLKSHHACIGWYPYFKQTVSATLTLFSRLEPLHFTKKPAHFNTLSMGFQKDSIFVDAFTPITAALFETGIYFTWEQAVNNFYKEIGRKSVRQKPGSDIYQKLVQLSNLGELSEKPLKMVNVWVMFAIMVSGWTFAAVGFVLEVIFRKHKVK